MESLTTNPVEVLMLKYSAEDAKEHLQYLDIMCKRYTVVEAITTLIKGVHAEGIELDTNESY